jgi:hypothetical protein
VSSESNYVHRQYKQESFNVQTGSVTFVQSGSVTETITLSDKEFQRLADPKTLNVVIRKVV